MASDLVKGVVLVVEDDDDIREDVADLLREEGYDVLTACDGNEALSRLRQLDHGCCVILLDLMMPGMDGWQFRGEQLNDQQLADVPVVVVSGVADVQGRAEQLHPAAVLRKPFHLDKLLDTVAHHCAVASPRS